jgi:hypothetical protein
VVIRLPPKIGSLTFPSTPPVYLQPQARTQIRLNRVSEVTRSLQDRGLAMKIVKVSFHAGFSS